MSKCTAVYMPRRAYLKYRDRQRLQKEEDRRTIEELHSRLKQLECERSDLEKRVELLQKVWSWDASRWPQVPRPAAAAGRRIRMESLLLLERSFLPDACGIVSAFATRSGPLRLVLSPERHNRRSTLCPWTKTDRIRWRGSLMTLHRCDCSLMWDYFCGAVCRRDSWQLCTC